MSGVSCMVAWFRRRTRAVAAARPSRRPALEALEDRSLPSTIPTPAHVVIVVEENHAFSEIIGSPAAPFINALAAAPTTALFTKSFALTHPSQPNYLLLFSGASQGVTDDSTPAAQFETSNLASALQAHGRSFVGFSEGLPSVGFTGDSAGSYARKHAPWVDWQGAGDHQLPAKVNQPLSAFPGNFNRLPTVSFVIPNLLHDMHDGSVTAGDTWLRQHLGGYIRWARSHNSLFILTTDEDDYSTANHVATLLSGAGVKGGSYAERITHLNLLRTIEDMYHLPRLGGSARVAPIANVWTGAR